MDKKEYEFSFYEFQKREEEFFHIPYKDEMRHFAYMKEGDFTGVREIEQTFRNPGKYSILSNDPLRR